MPTNHKTAVQFHLKEVENALKLLKERAERLYKEAEQEFAIMPTLERITDKGLNLTTVTGFAGELEAEANERINDICRIQNDIFNETK